jgi:hypothetical protein
LLDPIGPERTGKLICIVLPDLEDSGVNECQETGFQSNPIFRTKHGRNISWVHARSKEAPYYMSAFSFLSRLDQGSAATRS